MFVHDLFPTLTTFLKVWLDFVWRKLMASPANELIARMLYFPTIVRLMLLSSPKRPWYNRVDDTVILGALPLRRLTKELVEKEKVRALLSFCLPYELSSFTNSKEEWSSRGVEQHIYRTLDFTPPSMESIQEGMTVIQQQRAKKNTVYIHCKAGKGRSAVMTTCYVMKRYKLAPADAIDFLERKRPQIKMNSSQREAIYQFYDLLVKRK